MKRYELFSVSNLPRLIVHRAVTRGYYERLLPKCFRVILNSMFTQIFSVILCSKKCTLFTNNNVQHMIKYKIRTEPLRPKYNFFAISLFSKHEFAKKIPEYQSYTVNNLVPEVDFPENVIVVRLSKQLRSVIRITHIFK